MSAKCTKPPEGWTCTRGAGHEGPCAAQPTVCPKCKWPLQVCDCNNQSEPDGDEAYPLRRSLTDPDGYLSDDNGLDRKLETVHSIAPNKVKVDALITAVSARIPSSVTPSTRIEVHPSDWLVLVDEIDELRAALDEAGRAYFKLESRSQHALRRASHYLDWAAFHHVTAKSARELLRAEALAAWPDERRDAAVKVCADCSTPHTCSAYGCELAKSRIVGCIHDSAPTTWCEVCHPDKAQQRAKFDQWNLESAWMLREEISESWFRVWLAALEWNAEQKSNS